MVTLLTRRRRLIFRLISRRWQRRLIFLLGGVTVGAAAVGLAIAADFVQAEFARFLTISPYVALGLTPVGFATVAFLTRRFFASAQGSGIPQTIAARRLKDRASRQELVSLRIAAGKTALVLLGLLCGGSIGREGPTVQIGASIMFVAGRISRGHQPGLLLAGAAAGVAAAFNTPLAGIVFGIEEMSRSFEVRASGLIIGGVIAAGLTSLALIGNYTYFGATAAALHGPLDWVAVPVCGVVGGFLGGVFSRILIEAARGFPGRAGAWIGRHPVAFAALCGLGVAVAGLASGDSIYGSGYAHAKTLLSETGGAPWNFGLLKLAATALSAISGIPGGIFSPSLAAGAGLGANLAAFLPGTPTGAVIALGMVAYFTGVVQAPITAFVIVTEMTDNHAMLVPLMAASIIAYATSRLVCPVGVYQALAETFAGGDTKT